MDEKIKDQEVLLVEDQKDKTLKAVAGTDEKGGQKTLPLTAEQKEEKQEQKRSKGMKM